MRLRERLLCKDVFDPDAEAVEGEGLGEEFESGMIPIGGLSRASPSSRRHPGDRRGRAARHSRDSPTAASGKSAANKPLLVALTRVPASPRSRLPEIAPPRSSSHTPQPLEEGELE